MTDATFALGIDLGTTNSALASVPMANKNDSPQPLAIPQTVAPGETMAENLLPSFLYMSAEAERAPGAFALPWLEPGRLGRSVVKEPVRIVRWTAQRGRVTYEIIKLTLTITALGARSGSCSPSARRTLVEEVR